MKLLAKNKRATYDYELTERLVAGLALSGDEVKSIKAGHASLKGSFIALRGGEAYLTNAHVTPYAHANDKTALEPTRGRKLLLHRRQLDELVAHKQAGLSVVPTALLQDRQLVKLEIGIGRGKKRYDKRQTIKQRDTARDLARGAKA
ncbi:MAG TPA: SsrA-binding protein SmpB [Candidatus Saccharimonadia bacterium]|nr:SsrA-binding protein SmpB [Candidatus Saccharimonadia bacterium]